MKNSLDLGVWLMARRGLNQHAACGASAVMRKIDVLVKFPLSDGGCGIR
jgi:hypothetical protein